MRRLGIIIVLTFAFVAALGPTTLAARPGAAFRAHASSGVQGGSLHVSAKVLHAVRGNTFTATAVVHFSTGDVPVQLKRAGRSFQAGGRVSVPANASAGPVDVVVTITYGATPHVVTVQGRIHAAGD